MRTELLLVSVVAVGLAVTGCANVSDPHISYLGATPAVADEDDTAAPAGEVADALRHVNSNRVLGAMAFQKVTRAKVDPTRLVNSRR